MRFLLVFALYFVSEAFSATQDLSLFIENKVVKPDGFSRSAVLAGLSPNSVTYPGPLIVGNKNDFFNISVVNNLNDTSMTVETSIHWHGLFQKGSAWADGPAGVTQCPIVPGHAFKYSFQALDQAGTYWYHSHYGTQYCDGLRGAFVVYDPNDPYKSQYDYDNETTVITLSDWYHQPAKELTNLPPPTRDSKSTLINGKGRDPTNPTAELAVINVVKNKRYRFRLVSLACDPQYNFTIHGHDMIIIEVDGNSVQPYTVDFINIFAGQRYSFILHANKNPDNYWIRSEPVTGGPTGFTSGINSAILRYIDRDVKPTEPPTLDEEPIFTRPLNETYLQPLEDPAAPGLPELGKGVHAITLDIGFAGGMFSILDSTTNVTFDEKEHLPPPNMEVPVLLQLLSGSKSAQDILSPGSFIELPRDKVIELTIPGGSVGGRVGGPHPIHLHGHSFSVVRSAGSARYNFNNPVRRDVVSIGGADDFVTIRFKTDNPGPWILHCHIDWHLDHGLATVMAEDIPSIRKADHPPEAWDDLCHIFEDYVGNITKPTL